MRAFLSSRLDDLFLSMALLTRIPVPAARGGDRDALARALWAYPLVGALIAAAGAATFVGVRKLVGDDAVAALLAVAMTILLTGCFHEDGLADFWDGIGGGRTPERKLEIMRDSRIGSYGAAALVLVIGLRVALTVAVARHGLAAGALVAAGAIGRGAIAPILLLLDTARTEGLSVTASAPPASAGAMAMLLALAVAIAALPLGIALAAAGTGLLVAVASAELMRRQIGGYTGDGLGAAEQKCEVMVLATVLALAA